MLYHHSIFKPSIANCFIFKINTQRLTNNILIWSTIFRRTHVQNGLTLSF